ncbi:hypothetical protein FXF52_14445 [Micromonospora sp. MP36]|nr:hypothetical protein FXF52_14445 [Micromonospora sp. MP36]
MSGGLVGGKASPPPHHGGWEQPAGHPPTQPARQHAGEASPTHERECAAAAATDARGWPARQLPQFDLAPRSSTPRTPAR